MNTYLAAGVTLVGLLIVLRGIRYGYCAYSSALRDEQLPVWPGLERIKDRLRRPEPLPEPQTIAPEGIPSSATVSEPTLTRLPAEPTVEERIERLSARLAEIVERQDADRSAARATVDRLRADMAAQGTRLDEADDGLRKISKRISTGTARLQIKGLIWVGAGTAVMAIPTIWSALPWGA